MHRGQVHPGQVHRGQVHRGQVRSLTQDAPWAGAPWTGAPWAGAQSDTGLTNKDHTHIHTCGKVIMISGKLDCCETEHQHRKVLNNTAQHQPNSVTFMPFKLPL